MSEAQIISVPDIGDFDSVEIIEVHVKAGDEVGVEDSLIALESDKAVMDVPAPLAGKITEVLVVVGQKVSAGDAIARIVAAASQAEAADDTATMPELVQLPSGPAYTGGADSETELVVLGAGVAGYTAAFRAADLGREVTLVDRWPQLGGVCLNVGCIPSKALLHAAKIIDDAADFATHGIDFDGPPRVDTGKLGDWKDSIVKRLTGGLAGLAKRRKVKVVNGIGRFVSPHHLAVTSADGEHVIAYQQCIIAAGSEPFDLPGTPSDPRIMDSTDALELGELPERMLVIGGGIIGLEMACVYSAFGVRISVVELTDRLIPECDRDLVRPLQKRLAARYEQILLKTRVAELKPAPDGIIARLEGADGVREDTFGRVLVAVGRRPNGLEIDADQAGVQVDKRGFIPSDRHMRTNVAHIYSIGDVRGEPMLAHKGSYEGKVAAEVASGHKRAFDARAIPSVAYTDPEVAWVGVTETQAAEEGIAIEKATFPWAASGRALALGRDEGLTKLIFSADTRRVIGMGAVGQHAGDLVSEAALAIEMGCEAEDIGLTIHPHPTLSETVAMAAEMFDGSITDLYAPKR